MKKLFAILVTAILAVTACFGLTACGDSDYNAIKEKGYFVCGITIYEPMSYTNDDGEMTGFDTDFANAVADYLGLEAKFQVITWSKNFVELNAGSIDVIWNGFTVTEERKQNCDFSYSYMNNSQCIIVKTADLANYTTAESFANKKGVAEAGSAGETYAKTLVGETGTVIGSGSQTSALTDLLSGQSDFAVIDVLMADSMVGKGDYTNLSKVTAVAPEAEEYAIGFRQGSDFTEKVNEAIKALSANGTLEKIAKKYGLENSLVKNFD